MNVFKECCDFKTLCFEILITKAGPLTLEKTEPIFIVLVFLFVFLFSFFCHQRKFRTNVRYTLPFSVYEQFILRCMGTIQMCFHHFTKGNNFSDFLFACLRTYPFHKVPQRRKLFSLRVDSH